jgi:hypothetical protein
MHVSSWKWTTIALALLVTAMSGCDPDGQPTAPPDGEGATAETTHTSQDLTFACRTFGPPIPVCNNNGRCDPPYPVPVAIDQCAMATEMPGYCADCTTCAGKCGQRQPFGPLFCGCDTACILRGNCCPDKVAVCGGIPHIGPL